VSIYDNDEAPSTDPGAEPNINECSFMPITLKNGKSIVVCL